MYIWLSLSLFTVLCMHDDVDAQTWNWLWIGFERASFQFVMPAESEAWRQRITDTEQNAATPDPLAEAARYINVSVHEDSIHVWKAILYLQYVFCSSESWSSAKQSTWSA